MSCGYPPPLSWKSATGHPALRLHRHPVQATAQPCGNCQLPLWATHLISVWLQWLASIMHPNSNRNGHPTLSLHHIPSTEHSGNVPQPPFVQTGRRTLGRAQYWWRNVQSAALFPAAAWGLPHAEIVEPRGLRKTDTVCHPHMAHGFELLSGLWQHSNRQTASNILKPIAVTARCTQRKLSVFLTGGPSRHPGGHAIATTRMSHPGSHPGI